MTAYETRICLTARTRALGEHETRLGWMTARYTVQGWSKRGLPDLSKELRRYMSDDERAAIASKELMAGLMAMPEGAG